MARQEAAGIEVVLDPAVSKKSMTAASIKRVFPDYAGEALTWSREEPVLVLPADTPAEVMAILNDDSSLTVQS